MVAFIRSCRRFTPSVSAFIAALIGLAFLFACSGDDGTPTTPDDNGDPPINTIDTIPPADIYGLVITEIKSTWMVLHWKAPGDDGWTGTAAEYDIRHFNAPITEQNWNQATQVTGEPAPNPGGQIQEHRIDGLTPSTPYFFAVKTRDEVPNESGVSNTAIDTTLRDQVPPWPVNDLRTDTVNDTTFLLTWTATGNDLEVGTAAEYDIRYFHNRITEANWNTAEQVTGEPSPKTSGEPESLMVSGLSPNTNYWFAMKVADSGPNWSGLSNCAFALAHGVYLLTYPDVVHEGNDLTIYYRAEQDSHVRIELFFAQTSLNCGSGYVTLLSARYPLSGTYHMTYDCINPDTQDYIRHYDYVVSVCIDGVMRGTNRFTFTY